MKLTKFNPKSLFRSKKNQSIFLSDPTYYSSTSSSSVDGTSTHLKVSSTPKTVLPSKSNEISNDWSDLSSDIQYEHVQPFKLIEEDGDGKVTRRVLETLLNRLGGESLSEEEVMMMLREVDLDRDGCISLEKFRTIGSALTPAVDSDLREVFNFFDVDRDGKISAEELLEVFTVVGDDQCTLEDCQRMIAGVDLNGDGFVCFEDFSLLMEVERS